MPKQYLYVYLVVLFLMNIIWAFFPAGYEALEQKNANQNWVLPVEDKLQSPDLQVLVKNGFWGQVDSLLSSDSGTEAEIAETEAKKLRAQVRAIINNGKSKEVVFGISKVYQRIKLGDSLPDTQWILVDVGEDWLKLSRMNDKSKTEVLKLFAGQASGISDN